MEENRAMTVWHAVLKGTDVDQPRNLDTLPIGLGHAIAAGRLPRHHDDLFVRLLIARAQTEGLTLVSVDRTIARYDVPMLGVET